MKVVHLQTTDLGGSYKAVERIHRGLLKNGVDSEILLRTKHDADSVGDEAIHNPWQKLISRAKNVCNMFSSKGGIATERFGTDISRRPEVQSADVIILHWVNSFISERGVERLLALGKPVLWVAHDMWNFTGGCHCDRGCGRYAEGCGKCPLLRSDKKKDLSARNFLKKSRAFQGIVLVCPSRAYAECAKRSSIWKGQRVEWIHNPVDGAVFRPLADRKRLREHYHIQDNKKVILLGAVNIFSDKNKGGQYIRDIMSLLSEQEYQFVIFGNKPHERMENCSFTVHYLGYVSGDENMARVYNLADVFLSLSEQESFGYTVGEALSCGVPVAAYGVGGIAEQVVHGVNGYLAKCGQVAELAEGIAYCCRHEMRAVPQHNSLIETGQKYRTLCESLLVDRKKRG